MVDFSGSAFNESILRAMTLTLKHRGPDDWGVVDLGVAGLGHTRLSVIDLSSAAHQPMQSEDGQTFIVYNGEVYNFRELRQVLEREGQSFRSRSDTEVVLRAYLRWGLEALCKFNGMFALAIWDAEKKELLLARDRFGIKPLYYYLTHSGIIFGSEIKAILASGHVEQKIDPPGLHEYLYYGNALGTNTLFQGIRKLEPSHYLLLTANGHMCKSYWRLEDIQPVTHRFGKARETVRDLVVGAVKAHLVSDVPVGIFLSGGIDSSCITAIASRYYNGRLQTFSASFDYDKGANELEKARKVAEYYDTDHHEIHICGYDVADVIERLVHHHDQPFGDAANIPLFLLCEQLAGSIKVVLQGDGGDEIFAGYRRYAVLSAINIWRWVACVGLLGNRFTSRGPGHYRRRRFFQAIQSKNSARRMALLLTQEALVDSPTLSLSPTWQDRLLVHDPFARYYDHDRTFKDLDPVQRMLWTDVRVLLPDIFLEKVDRSTMAHGIEVRVPFIDGSLTQYVLGLPSAYKVRWGHKKRILRSALRGIVPDAVLDGPKTGFGVPYQYWLRGPLLDYMRAILLDSSIQDKCFFNYKALDRLIHEHSEGKRDWGFLLWKVLNLALWLKRYAIQL